MLINCSAILGGNRTSKRIIVFAVLAILVSTAGAANYMYEKASVKGVGYKDAVQIISTKTDINGTKLVEKASGSGIIITEKIELEAERQVKSCFALPNDYVNITKESEFEYMPISYQTGVYDQKWLEKLCVQNYEAGAVLTEMYSHAEHLEKATEVKAKSGPNIEHQVLSAPPGYQWWYIGAVGNVYSFGLINTRRWDDTAPASALQGFHWEKHGRIGRAQFQSFGLVSDTEKGSAQPTIMPPIEPPLGYHWGIDGNVFALLANNPGYVEPPSIQDKYLDASNIEANLNSNIIGVAHIGWISRNPLAENQLKGRHAEYGRSIEDLTGVFSIEKFIYLWANSTCGAISVDWLPCM